MSGFRRQVLPKALGSACRMRLAILGVKTNAGKRFEVMPPAEVKPPAEEKPALPPSGEPDFSGGPDAV